MSARTTHNQRLLVRICEYHEVSEGVMGMARMHEELAHADALTDVFNYIEGFHHPRMQCRIDARNKAFTALAQLSAKTG